MTELQELNINSLGKTKGYVKNSTIGFLLYFLPLFSLKMLGLDVTGNAGRIITVIAVAISIFIMHKITCGRKRMTIWMLLLMIGIITVIMSGKYSIFFSIFTLFLLDQVKQDQLKYIYKDLLIVGTILLLIALVQSINTGDIQSRFINGTYTLITKRPNYIYVDFFALANIYLLSKKKVKTLRFCILYLFIGNALYIYTGSRSGFLCVVIEIMLLILFEKTKILQKNFVRTIIPHVTIILFIVNFLFNWGYGKISFLTQLNLMLQNRLRYGKLFLTLYRPKLFGQRIAESYAVENYQVLDNTYLSMLLIYGLVISVVWIGLNYYCASSLTNRLKSKELAILFSYLLYGFTESFVVVSFISMIFFVYSECLHNNPDISLKKEKKRRRISLFRGSNS